MTLFEKILNGFWSLFNKKDFSQEKVESIYDSQASAITFSRWLVDNGYYWKSDGTNYSMKSDNFVSPRKLLARRWGNCSDYMRLFVEFLIYKKQINNGSVIKFYDRDRPDVWHYVLVWEDINGAWFYSSNQYVGYGNLYAAIALFKDGYSDYEVGSYKNYVQ